MKLRIVYSKTGLVRFISHLDLLRLFFRAIARAGIPIKYSSGFSPHPRVSFGPPLKVGMEGENELLDIHLAGPVETGEAKVSLNRHLPEGMRVIHAAVMTGNLPGLGKIIREAEYSVNLAGFCGLDQNTVSDFLAASNVPVVIEKKGKRKEINSRRGVIDLRLTGRGTVHAALGKRKFPPLRGFIRTDRPGFFGDRKTLLAPAAFLGPRFIVVRKMLIIKNMSLFFYSCKNVLIGAGKS